MVDPSVSRLAFLTLCSLLVLPSTRGTCDVTLAKLTPVPLNGIEARPAPGAGLARVTFRKDDPSRRLLALRARPTGIGAGVRSLALRYRLRCAGKVTARPAVLVFDADGESWVKMADPVPSSPDLQDTRLSLAALRPTDFSPKRSGAVEWLAVREVWIGVLLDGPTQGELEIASASLVDTPQRPTTPLSLTGGGAGTWTVHHDPAVQVASSTPNEGPGGRPCFRVEFAYPGGRHLFCNSSLPLPAADLEGYRALKMTYRATLPPGIGGLLVLFSEDSGACYRAEPMPPANADWSTLEIPLERLKLAEWTKDPDGKLDMGKVTSIWVGTHGAAAAAGGLGRIEVCDLQLVP